MPAATINRLLERLSFASLVDEKARYRQMRQELDDFRKERESVDGPISEQQWRGILLSAIDLLDPSTPEQEIIRESLMRLIQRLRNDAPA